MYPWFEKRARLASLGLQKTISGLLSLTSSPKSDRTHVRKYSKVDYSSTPLRRSARLRGKSPPSQGELGYAVGGDWGENGNEMVLDDESLRRRQFSPEEKLWPGAVKARAEGVCNENYSKKKLCGEEDCKRCGDLDMGQPCLGKTDCSICHSSNGILCQACLKVRYSEEMEEVRSNKEWMYPHCVENKGINPYWICNSSFCLKKREMVPTGIAIFRAREMGYKSVARQLMDELQRADKR